MAKQAATRRQMAKRRASDAPISYHGRRCGEEAGDAKSFDASVGDNPREGKHHDVIATFVESMPRSCFLRRCFSRCRPRLPRYGRNARHISRRLRSRVLYAAFRDDRRYQHAASISRMCDGVMRRQSPSRVRDHFDASASYDRRHSGSRRPLPIRSSRAMSADTARRRARRDAAFRPSDARIGYVHIELTLPMPSAMSADRPMSAAEIDARSAGRRRDKRFRRCGLPPSAQGRPRCRREITSRTRMRPIDG